jgi:hypothetical protein
MHIGIQIRPQIDVEYLSILLWENTVGWAHSAARGTPSFTLRQLAASYSKSQFFLSHKDVEQECCSTRAGHQTVLSVDLHPMNDWIGRMRSSVITSAAQ